MKIAIALDGGPFADQAIPWAQLLASNLQASVVAVRAVDPFVPGTAGLVPSMMIRLQEEELGKAQEQMKGCLPKNWETQVVLGDPKSVLGSWAASDKIAGLVLASHGRSGGARWLLGSVAEAVLRHSHVPMLIVRPSASPKETRVDAAVRRVLVPLDGSETATQVLDDLPRWVGENTELILLRATGFGVRENSSFLSSDQLEDLASALEEDLQSIRPAGFAKIDHLVLDADPAEAILAAAEQRECDLIAMSTHGRSGWRRFLLGSVTEKVARHARCPVLAFPIGSQLE